MNPILNRILSDKQIQNLEFTDTILFYEIVSLISIAISVYALGLKRKNILTPEGETPPVDSLYIRKLSVVAGILSLIIYIFYYKSSKQALDEAEVKTKSLWIDYLASAIDFIPTLLRLYIILCLTTSSTTVQEELIGEL